MRLIVAKQYPDEEGKLSKETDGDWMRFIDFEALSNHVENKLKEQNNETRDSGKPTQSR